MADRPLTSLLLPALAMFALGVGAGAWYFGGAHDESDSADVDSAQSEGHDQRDQGTDDAGAPANRKGHRALPGRWRPAPEAPEEHTGDADLLNNLGYAGGYEPSPEEDGVVFFADALAQPGLNLCHDGGGPSARLMSMDGEVLHEWRYELKELLTPEEIREIGETFNAVPDKFGYYRRVHPFPNGDLLAIFSDAAVIKLDRDSNLLWAWRGNPHHDLYVDEETGRIHVLTRKVHIVKRYSPVNLSAEDFVTVLSADGEFIEEYSILRAFEKSDYNAQTQLLMKGGNLQHANTIEVLDGRFADRSPAFERGNVLISLRRTDTIAIISGRTKQVVWAMSGAWRAQHQPTFLDNGNLLLLDNRGHFGRSKVIEFDPLTREIVWAYRHSEATPFWTETCGSNERLENGNTLITESDTGRAFEVAPDGRIVWEYLTPTRAGPNDEFIATLLEVIRLPEDYYGDAVFD